MAYFTALDLAAESANQIAHPRRDLQLAGRQNGRQVAPKQIHAVPGSAANTLDVLAEFDLTDLAPGAYMLLVDAEDTIRHSRNTGQVEFAIE